MNFLLKTLNYNMISPVPRKHLAPLSILGTSCPLSHLQQQPLAPRLHTQPTVWLGKQLCAGLCPQCGQQSLGFGVKQSSSCVHPRPLATGTRGTGFLLFMASSSPGEAVSLNRPGPGVAVMSVQCLLLLHSRCSINGSSH